MDSALYYVLRSQANSNYLTAHPNPDTAVAYLLVFSEQFDALSYLNTHGSEVSQHFQVETLPTRQLRGVLDRWQLQGIGLVQDPLLPRIEFLQVKAS
ncbi:MAG: hypothetical protein AAF329_13430 [Cyanobacteria bacterium P01_A01_bin.17]